MLLIIMNTIMSLKFLSDLCLEILLSNRNKSWRNYLRMRNESYCLHKQFYHLVEEEYSTSLLTLLIFVIYLNFSHLVPLVSKVSCLMLNTSLLKMCHSVGHCLLKHDWLERLKLNILLNFF